MLFQTHYLYNGFFYAYFRQLIIFQLNRVYVFFVTLHLAIVSFKELIKKREFYYFK